MSVGSNNLWQFACTLYAYEPVKELCLRLQNGRDANVDLILWLCWLHLRKLRLDRSVLVEAQQLVGGVSESLIKGLRGMRGPMLKCSGYSNTQQQELRDKLLAAELAVESIVLQQLQELTLRSPAAAGPDYLTLADYLHSVCAAEAAHAARQLTEATDRFC